MEFNDDFIIQRFSCKFLDQTYIKENINCSIIDIILHVFRMKKERKIRIIPLSFWTKVKNLALDVILSEAKDPGKLATNGFFGS